MQKSTYNTWHQRNVSVKLHSEIRGKPSHNIKCISRNSVHHKIGGFFKKCSVGCWKCGERGLVRVGALLNQNFLEGGHFWKEGRCGNFIIVINQLISTERSFPYWSPGSLNSFDLQQGAGAEPLLGMLAFVARVLASAS